MLDKNLPAQQIDSLNKIRNNIKEPYEFSQMNFENFFSSYYVIMSYFLEQERNEHSNSNVMKSIEKNKEKVMQLIYEGIQNPVVASALH